MHPVCACCSAAYIVQRSDFGPRVQKYSSRKWSKYPGGCVARHSFTNQFGQAINPSHFYGLSDSRLPPRFAGWRASMAKQHQVSPRPKICRPAPRLELPCPAGQSSRIRLNQGESNRGDAILAQPNGTFAAPASLLAPFAPLRGQFQARATSGLGNNVAGPEHRKLYAFDPC